MDAAPALRSRAGEEANASDEEHRKRNLATAPGAAAMEAASSSRSGAREEVKKSASDDEHRERILATAPAKGAAAMEAASSSRSGAAHEEANKSANDEERNWVVLVSIPIVIGSDDGRAASFPRGTDFFLDRRDAPHPSYLLVPEAMAPGPSWPGSHPYIFACDSSARLVAHATQGEGVFDSGLFLCDGHARTATRLPPPPPDLGVQLHRRRRDFGLILNPHRLGHYLIAQLHPTPATHHESLLFYSTATKTWGRKKFASSPEHKLWGAHGVIAYDGLLWWVDAAYGMLVCDPFLNRPHLRFVPLPPGCEIEDPIVRRSWIDDSRIVRTSEGKLRFVELKGLPDDDQEQEDFPENATVSMWTLLDPDGPRWHREYEVPFAEIWAYRTYLAAKLPPGKLPKLALVHPNNHCVIYFFHGKSLFGVDVGEKRVVACEDCLVHLQLEDNPQEFRFQTSRFVDAWELPPGLGDDPSCDGSSEKVPTHLLGGTKGNIIRVHLANPLVNPLPSSVLPEDNVASIKATEGLEKGMKRLELQLKEEQDVKARRKLLRQQAYVEEMLECMIDSDGDCD